MIKKVDYDLFPHKGKKDAKRHRDKVKDAIKKNIADIIAEEPIITRKGKRTVKIPIRGLKSYKFIFDRGKGGGAGIGQGKGKPGDVIGRSGGKRGKGKGAGDEPGVDYFETEIDIEELIEMMLEDLGLPNLQKKGTQEILVPKGFVYDSVEKVGPIVRLDKKRTLKEAIKKNKIFIRRLVEETKKSYQECETAFLLAKGDYEKALEILKSKKNLIVNVDKKKIFIFDEDLRFRTVKEDFDQESNAVVFAMIDSSGSMYAMKKYLARSLFFWLVEFLRKIYKKVEIRFISHDFGAKLVEEEDFFRKGESGGTFCGSAYELAKKLIEKEYDPKRWNIYAFHFSDGDDFYPQRSTDLLKDLIEMGINMFGYAEIKPESGDSLSLFGASPTLLSLFCSRFHLEKDEGTEVEIYTNSKKERYLFLASVIHGKTDLWPVIKEFLDKNKWERR